MVNIAINREKIERLKDFYKQQGQIVLIGLNDSQEVNVNSTFFRKGMLEYLADSLASEGLVPEIINASSLTMNKTEHIDYFLRNNLSVEEIKLSQIYSAVSALEKVMTDTGLPKFLGQVGNAYRLIYTPRKGDEEIHISTLLQEAQRPIVMYSSAVNNFMREIGSNPYAIIIDYKARHERVNYDYTLEKIEDPRTLEIVMDGVRKNYNTILGINPNADIYILGAYIPKSLQIAEMEIFRNAIMDYNRKMADLCRQYGATFIDTEEVGKKYNNSKINLHISNAGHNALANHILECMYSNIFESNSSFERKNIIKTEITNEGSLGVFSAIDADLVQAQEEVRRAKEIAAMVSRGASQKDIELSNYAIKRAEAIVREREREAYIFKKVYKKVA